MPFADDIAGLGTNPIAIAGAHVASGKPLAAALVAGAQQARQAQAEALQLQEAQRQAQGLANISETIQGVDSSDPAALFTALVQSGVEPSAAATVASTVGKNARSDQLMQMLMGGMGGGGEGLSPDKMALLGAVTGNPSLISGATFLQNKDNRGTDKDREDVDNQFKRENVLRDEYNAKSKPFGEIKAAYDNIKAAGAGESAAGDISLTIAFMKMLDPGSVVREGEFATAQNAAGVPERIRAQFNKLLTGERLSPVQRADFMKQAENIFGKAKKRQGKVVRGYEKLAQRNGLKPENVLVDFENDDTEPGDAEPGADTGETQTITREELEHTAKTHNKTVDEVIQDLKAGGYDVEGY